MSNQGSNNNNGQKQQQLPQINRSSSVIISSTNLKLEKLKEVDIIHKKLMIQKEVQKDIFAQTQRHADCNKPINLKLEIDKQNLFQKKSNFAMKDFQLKLDLHKSEINSRTEIIQELEKQVEYLKTHFASEKEQSIQKSKMIRELRNQIENFKQDIYIQKNQLNLFSHERNDDDHKRIISLQQRIHDLENNLQSTQQKLTDQTFQTSQYQQIINQLNLDLTTSNKNVQKFQNEIIAIQKEKEEEEVQNSKNLSDTQSKIKEIIRLRKELTKITEDHEILKDNHEKAADQLQNFYNVKPSRSEILLELEAKEGELLKIIRQNDEIKRREKFIVLENQNFKQEIEKQNGLLVLEKEKNQQLQKDLREQVEHTKRVLQELLEARLKIDQLSNSIYEIQQKQHIINDSIQNIVKYEKDLKKSLKCHFCCKMLTEPVTVIPCGHSYCLQCKEAYMNACAKCGPSQKVEAVYRNELLDDIMNMVKFMENVRTELSEINFSNLTQRNTNLAQRQ